MPIPKNILDDIRERVGLADFIGRYLKLTRRGHEHAGLCPFHNEKTPSFTVNEQKGFYHCFGCGAHGDVISFAMNHLKLEFREAAEQLAREAGIEIPRATPEDRKHEAFLERLYAANAAASQWFAAQLTAEGGEQARQYLASRHVDPKTVSHFNLGYAPPGRNMLTKHLAAKGFTREELLASGLCGSPESDGDVLYDRFRDRLMFPIRNRRGRPIAFGGRALKDAKAKYLNSSETPIFKKGSTLYNLDQAQVSGRQASEILAVEGYMDVIALTQTGFENVVAPLGTALTEAQIDLLWRIAPEPLLCFDGDSAGQRAAARAVQRALPNLRAGRSIKIVTLPQDEDPDSLVQRRGREGVVSVVDTARPLVDWLWNALEETADLSTPERAAELRRNVAGSVRNIRDREVRDFYRREFDRRLDKLLAQQFPPRRQAKALTARSRRRLENMKPQQLTSSADQNLERLIVLILVNHPALLSANLEALSTLTVTDPDAARLLDLLLAVATSDSADLAEALSQEFERQELGPLVERLRSDRLLKVHSFTSPSVALETAERGMRHLLDRLETLRNLKSEIAEAQQQLTSAPTDDSWQRFRALTEEFRRASVLPSE